MMTNDRRQKGLMPFAVDLKQIVKPILGKRGFSSVDLIEKWTDIVGTDLSMGVVPEKISYPKADRMNGILHVVIKGGPFALLFEHRKNRVLERINAFMGYQAVSGVKIRQEGMVDLPLPEKPAKKINAETKQKIALNVAGIADDDLRASVAALGEAILSK